MLVYLGHSQNSQITGEAVCAKPCMCVCLCVHVEGRAITEMPLGLKL